MQFMSIVSASSLVRVAHQCAKRSGSRMASAGEPRGGTWSSFKRAYFFLEFCPLVFLFHWPAAHAFYCAWPASRRHFVLIYLRVNWAHSVFMRATC